jgi:hypothetical protein
VTALADRLGLDEEAAQLCDPYQHRERRLVRTKGRKQRAEHHTTRWPSLLDQLRAVLVEPMCQVEDACRRVPDSAAPGNPHALAAFMAIEAGALAWVAETLRVQPRPDPEGNIRYLLGAAYGQPVHTARITSAVHRWWELARVGTGWDTAPRTLPDPCPWCGSRTVHVRVREGDIAETSSAWCTECTTTWEGVEVRVLGREIELGRVSRAASARLRREAERERRRAEEEALLDNATSVASVGP